jgi:hypothetical protein
LPDGQEKLISGYDVTNHARRAIAGHFCLKAKRLKARVGCDGRSGHPQRSPEAKFPEGAALAAPYSPPYRLALVKPAADWGVGQNFVNLA